MRIALPVVCFLYLIAGCVSPQRHADSFATVDFSRYKTVSYSVVTTPTTEYGENDKGYGKQTVDLFRILLGQTLQNMGYQVVESGAELHLDLQVTAVKPGSGAARFWVGFGAGRAVLTYSAEFFEQDRKLAGFSGGESYIGIEPGRGFASIDEIKTFAATTASKQVETFMLNGGRFPESKAKTPTNPTRS